MIRLKASLVAGLGCLALVGCAGSGLEEAKNRTPTGDEFSQNLYSGYVDLSEAEYNEYDFRDSDQFAAKATTASDGTAVAPDQIVSRDLPEARVALLSDSRDRLMAAMDAGAATKSPVNAARAQVMFDCWMQEQEENIQPQDIAACQAGFSEAMAALQEDMTEPPAVAAAPEPAPKPVVDPKSWTVYFDFDSAELSDAEAAKVREMVSYAKETGGQISLVGHTDRAGAEGYNDLLSAERAAAVAKMMEGGGVSDAMVATAAVGEKDLAVSTDDGKAEPLNRRVVVTITNN